jgi:hypothetical protein
MSWGIYDTDGNPLADEKLLSTGAVEYSKETKISDFPLERGGFASYNKVETPANPRVTLYFTGSENERTEFLNTLDEAVKSTDLYSVVTPEMTYIEYSIEKYDYQRTHSKGANLLIVDLALREIRQVEAQYTKASQVKDVGAVPPVDSGKVQTKQPEKSLLKKLFGD